MSADWTPDPQNGASLIIGHGPDFILTVLDVGPLHFTTHSVPSAWGLAEKGDPAAGLPYESLHFLLTWPPVTITGGLHTH